MRSFSRLALSVLALTVAAARISSAQAPGPAATPLRPGDRLVVQIWTDTSLAATLQLDQNSSVILPKLGPLPLNGVPAQNIADSVRSAYSHLFFPVAVEVTPLRRVTVVGEVQRPGLFYVDMNSTVRDVIASAGGINDIGTTEPVYLIRDSTTYTVRDWDTRRDSFIVLQSGDVVSIHRDSWLKRNVFSIISGLGILASLAIAVTR